MWRLVNPDDVQKASSLTELCLAKAGSKTPLANWPAPMTPMRISSRPVELVACKALVEKHDGDLKLVLTEEQRGGLASVKLDGLFDTYTEEEAALDSLVPWYSTAGIP